MKMKLFLMNDDYNTVVCAKDKKQAEEYFRSTFPEDEIFPDDDYCSVYREIFPDEKAIFDGKEMTFGEFVKNIKDIPTIVCWRE